MDLKVIEIILNSFKVKYNVLLDLINNSSAEGDNMNIYINLDSIFNNFYVEGKDSAMNSLTVKESLIMVSELINIAAHYRHFFWSRFRATTKIYFYYCNKRPKWQKKKVDTYFEKDEFNKSTEHPKFSGINETIEDVLKLFSKVIEYIQEVYYVPSDGLEPSIIPYYLIKNTGNENTCHMVISKDKIDYQLCNINNTFIVSPRGVNTKMIEAKTIYDHKFKSIKYRPKNHLSPELYPLLIAFLGDKKRGIPKVKGCTLVHTLKTIDKLIDDELIKNGLNKSISLDTLSECIDEVSAKQIKNNYKCINFNRVYHLLTEMDSYNIRKHISNNKYDNESIMNLNGTYFQNNNIKLIELSEGIDR